MFYSSKCELNVAVIGKSAAGKSAFIKSFSKFPNLINSEGRGQTTRSYAEYTFQVKEGDFPLETSVKIMAKEEFITTKASHAYEKLKKLYQDEVGNEEPVSFEWLYEQYCDISFSEEIDEILIYADDFFNIKEFSFLDDKNCINAIRYRYDDFKRIIKTIATKVYELIKVESWKDELVKNISDKIKKYQRDFCDDNIQVDNENGLAVLEILRMLYDEIYDVIIGSLKKEYQNTGILFDRNGVLSFKFQVDEHNKDILALFLKVIRYENEEVRSYTGIISKVQINGVIASEYYSIFKDLGISKVTLVDTYGLDHEQTIEDEMLKERYHRIFNIDYPNITTVFFIEALHHGASNEFIQAMKILYSKRPDIMTYIIGTYIDEHDENTLNESEKWLISQDKYPENVKIPELNGKAIDFLYNGRGLLNTLKRNQVHDSLAQKRIEVMRKRFGPFCGKIENEASNYNLFTEINLVTIKCIFGSIIDKEHLGDGYINIDKILETLETNLNIEIILGYMIEHATKGFIDVFNKSAARTKGKIHTNIKNYKLGFNGSTIDATWYRVFNDAYNKSFTKQISINNSPTCLSDEFNCIGNEKIAFDELLNTFFPYLFNTKCRKSVKLNYWEREISCKICADKGEFNQDCMWGLLINLAGSEGFLNRSNYDTVLAWLIKLHGFKDKSNQVFYYKLKELFVENMKEKFIPLCREHNVRIAKKYLIKGEGDYISLKKSIVNEYKRNYDHNVEYKEFLKMINR